MEINITFKSSPLTKLPSIAQLVERWTVVVRCQTSIGRWFKSGSKDSFKNQNVAISVILVQEIVNLNIDDTEVGLRICRFCVLFL